MRGRIVIAGLLMVAGCGGEPPHDAPVRIGLLVPLTGPLSGVGTSVQAVAEEAVADVNAGGGVTVELIVRDDMIGVDGAPEIGDVVTEMIDEGIEVLVGPLESGNVPGAVAVAGPRGVPVVSNAQNTTLLGDWDDGWFFDLAPLADEQARALEHYLVEVSDPAAAGATIVRTEFDAFGDELEVLWPSAAVIEYTAPLDDSTAGALWAQIAAAGSGAAVFTGYGDDANALLRAWDTAGSAPGFTWFLGDFARAANLFDDTLPPLPASAAGIRGVAHVYFAYDGIGDDVFETETIDAIHLVAAAQMLEARDGLDPRDALLAASRDGEVFRSDQWPALVAAIQAGADVDLDGVAVPWDFDDNGEVHGFHEIWRLVLDPGAGWLFEQIEVLDPRDY